MSHPVDLVRWYLPEIEEVTGFASLSDNGRAGGLANPDTFHFVLRAADGRIARVSGSYSGPTVPAVRDSSLTCILRADGVTPKPDAREGVRTVVVLVALEEAARTGLPVRVADVIGRAGVRL